MEGQVIIEFLYAVVLVIIGVNIGNEIRSLTYAVNNAVREIRKELK